jgi:anti-sigma B factor antagonist
MHCLLFWKIIHLFAAKLDSKKAISNMKTAFREENQNYVMTFEGRLDTPSSFQVGRDMQVLYDCEGHDIILDCTNLEYITSSGMRLFLDLLKVAKSKGSKCMLVGLNEEIYAVFDEVGFINLFEIRQAL